MKKHPRPLVVLLLAILAIIVAGCSERSKKETSTTTVVAPPAPVVTNPPVTPAPIGQADPFNDVAAALSNLPREQASSIAPMLVNMNGIIDTRLTAWKAAGTSNATGGEDRLARARADFAQKVDALSFADEVAWKNVRSEAQNSLSNLQRAYRDLFGSP